MKMSGNPSDHDERPRLDAATLPDELQRLWDTMLRLDPEWEGRYVEYDPMFPGNGKGTPSEYSRMTGLSIQLFYYLGRYDKKDSQ